MIALHKFHNIIELSNYFNDDMVCRNYLEQIRWQDKLKCPYKDCLHDKVFKFSNGKTYKCAKCRRRYSVTVGSIFEDTKIPLQKWFAAIYLITSHKKGISSLQLGKDITVSQKTAWFMLHRLRHSLNQNMSADKLSGTIEADETFMGGAEGNKHKNKRTENTQGRSVKTKSAVAGVIERGGELRAEKIEDTSGKNLRPFVAKNVQFGAKLMTDEWLGYKGLAQGFQHKYVKHNEGEYVFGDIHTNSMEGFWSLLKRGVNGIYHSISSKHLQNYIDEYVFRYNTRRMTEDYRFDYMLNSINTRLTYKALIADKNAGNQFTQTSLNI
jgi:transposase-like protein